MSHQYHNPASFTPGVVSLVVAVRAEPVPLWDDHEGGAQAGGVVAGITAVTQQNPLGMVTVACKMYVQIHSN